MSNQMNQRFQNKKKPKPAAGDDRNLVLVDEDFQDADFEDRVWLFWQRHGRKTVTGAVVLFLAIIGVIVYVEVGKMRLEALKAEYAAAETAEQKLAFARGNESDPLAGTAYFAVGGEYADAGKFAEAADAFGNAARVFSGEKEFYAMRDRASIAQAACLARQNTPDAEAQADALLKKLAGTPDADPLYRGQAMYELAAVALAKGDLSASRLWLNEMDRALDPMNPWQIRKGALIALEPKLAQPETPAAVPAAAPEAEIPAAEEPVVPAQNS